jgi:uncharacterized membrane protein
LRVAQDGPYGEAVLALRPHSSRVFRWVELRDGVREHFWIIPSVMLLGGVVLAWLTASAESLGVPRAWSRGLPVDQAGASAILGVLATSMLTFVGVVFTMTLVALQLASAQLSPRVVRTFTRSTLTKVAFGTFLATFSFSVVVLVLEEGTANADARSRAVTAAFVLVMASVVVFIAYAAQTVRLLQVSWVITAVAEETRGTLADAFPDRAAYVEVEAPLLVDEPVVVHLPLPAPNWPGGGHFGVVLGTDRHRLVKLAQRYGCVLEVLVRHGQYVPSGGAMVAVHGGTVPPAHEVVGCFHLGRGRTMYQDPAFGIRQLVDVAIQALSPALNQAGTATQVVDRLVDILLRIARQPWPTGLFVDDDGTVRLIERRPSWSEILDLAFTEIVLDGAGSPQVTRRLAAAYDRLGREVPPDLAPAVEPHRSALAAAVERAGRADPGVALASDPLGMG